MDVSVTVKNPSGAVAALPSKSDAHRVMICAAQARGRTRFRLPVTSEDMNATLSCISALGASVQSDSGFVTISPGPVPPGVPSLNCGESGSTLRFLLPVAAATAERTAFSGRGRLPQRPISELMAAMRSHGVEFTSDSLPFETKGLMTGGQFTLPGNISSQYVTGLLLALPKVGGSIELTSPLQSAPYVEITLKTMEKFGVDVEKRENGYSVPLCEYVSPGDIRIDGDWSNAAFFLCLGALGGHITVTGLDEASPQGDRRICEILSEAGASVKTEKDGSVTAAEGRLRAMDIDVTDIPDLLPVLAVLFTAAEGCTRFYGGARLRLKESDRLHTTAVLINSLGGRAEETDDGLRVYGRPLSGGTADSFGDHRIAMAAAVASAVCRDSVTILNAEASAKSYPSFFDDFQKTGGVCHVI